MKTLIFYFSLFFSLSLAAQSNLTVTYTRGKVYYYPPQQDNPRTVYPGLTLSSGGRLRCDQDAKVTLLCMGKTFEFEDTKMHFLDEVARTAGNTSSLSFMGRFWGFLTGSMEGTEDNKRLEEHHKQSMESLRAGIKGYAVSDFAIQTDMLFEGKLSDNEVAFTWSAKPDLKCCYRLTRQADDGLVLLTWTRGNTLRLNLADLALEDGGVYEWQIITKVGDPEAPHSRKMQFAYHPSMAAKALSVATDQSDYKTVSPVEQQLMEIFSLEKNSFFYDAYNRYKKLAADNPEDLLVKRAFAAFLARIDKLEEAKSLIK